MNLLVAIIAQCYRHGDSYNWYVCNEKNSKKRKYLAKSEEKKAAELATKGYIQAERSDASIELKAIQNYLKSCKTQTHAEDYLKRNSEYRRLVDPYFGSLDKAVEDWHRGWEKGSEDYQHPKDGKYMSQAGFPVSSKSEQLIVALLLKHRVAFRYEKELFIDGYALYPDFTIMHPRTHQIILWEHMGMMDLERYRNHNAWKLEQYAKIGFFAGDNLVITFETDKSGCDEVMAEYVIEHYFE